MSIILGGLAVVTVSFALGAVVWMVLSIYTSRNDRRLF